MNAPAEAFQFRPALRQQTPVLWGLVGPSGSGKTFSALRLATGIQSVVGGDIAVIDTEARRALHYARQFKFLHCDFKPPHGPDRYLEVIRAAVETGAKTIITDSMSHEHEGEGGLLEWHEAELDRLAGDDYRKREAVKMLAWAKPKGARRKLINGLLQLNANFIFCFRAKEKVKMVKNAAGKTEIVDMGWQAIAGEEFVYEMTGRCLLLPGSEGRPTWDREAWETGVPKWNAETRALFSDGGVLDEATGAAMARWAQGEDQAPLPPELLQSFAAINVSPEQIVAYLGRVPNAGDTKALKAWGRDIKEGKVKPPVLSTQQTIDPADKPDTGAESKETEAPQRDAPKEHPQSRQEAAGEANDAPVRVTYAQVAVGLSRAATRDELDEAALLIDAVAAASHRKELVELYKRRQQELEG